GQATAACPPSDERPIVVGTAADGVRSRGRLRWRRRGAALPPQRREPAGSARAEAKPPLQLDVSGTAPARRFWGWGREGEGPGPEQRRAIAQVLAARFELPELTITEPPRLEELRLPAPRVRPPAAL